MEKRDLSHLFLSLVLILIVGVVLPVYRLFFVNALELFKYAFLVFTTGGGGSLLTIVANVAGLFAVIGALFMLISLYLSNEWKDFINTSSLILVANLVGLYNIFSSNFKFFESIWPIIFIFFSSIISIYIITFAIKEGNK